MSDGTKPLLLVGSFADEMAREDGRLWAELEARDAERAATRASARAWMEKAMELAAEIEERQAWHPHSAVMPMRLIQAVAERDALAAENAALRNAIEHAIDLGPPCPFCRAEDDDEEGYPHTSECVVWALSSPSSAADAYVRSIQRAERERCAVAGAKAVCRADGECPETICEGRMVADAIRALGDEP